jgi:hypothetical protein
MHFSHNKLAPALGRSAFMHGKRSRDFRRDIPEAAGDFGNARLRRQAHREI